jgi:hypothetical protein
MFCGATGVTKAHIFAKSWTSLFDGPNDTREHEVVHRYTDPTTGERRVLKRAKTFALVSRKVCGACNSGWLRELEVRVRPLMARFAANTLIALNAEEQADLALWSVAAALIAMSNDPDAAGFADPAIAHEVFRERRPPNGMDVWLGANSHGEMGWFGSHSLSLAPAPRADRRVGRDDRVRLRRHPPGVPRPSEPADAAAPRRSTILAPDLVDARPRRVAAEAGHAPARPHAARAGGRRAVLL